MKLLNKSILFFLFFMYMNFCFSQSFDDVLSKAFELYKDRLFLCENNYDSIVKSDSFDFLNFTPKSTNNDSLLPFSVYYFQEEVSCVEYSGSEYSYKLNVYSFGNYTYLLGKGTFDFIEGVIIVDSDLKSIYFIQVSHSPANMKTSFSFINYIMKLDDMLFPLYKMHILGKHIMYITEFKYATNKHILHEMLFLPTCGYSSEINSFPEVNMLFVRKLDFTFLSTILPDVRCRATPLWQYGNYAY